jgi:hypothetical protein
MIEAAYDSKRETIFNNLFADTLFLYYIIIAGAVLKSDRRKVKR